LSFKNLEAMEKIEHGYGSDVDIVEVKGKRFVIIGTAHVSKESAELVRTVIEQEKPDKVCVELDEQRYKALSQKKKWESLDIKQVIKQKQLSNLIINIVLASYQKKIGEQLGVMPGTELLEAAKTAEEMGIPIVLADRDVRTTLKRAWSSMTFWQKLKFLSSGLAGVFDKEEITEEKLTELREKDALNELLSELGREMPILKRVLIDERDSFISTKMQNAEGEKIVSVVGAGHKQGIIEAIKNEKLEDLEKISVIPPPSPWVKIIGWGIPAIIIASLFFIGFTKGSAEAGENVLFWILANGIPSALGALCGNRPAAARG